MKTPSFLTTTRFACFTIALVTVNFSTVSAGAGFFDKETKLTAADAAVNDRFGSSVAISGNTILVGAILEDDGGSDTGSAYLFDVTTGNQYAKLTADPPPAFGGFGTSAAISGNTAIVGAYGSAYLFDITTGNQLAQLTAADDAVGGLFGWSVAIDGNMAVVGARGHGFNSGSAYLFDTTTGSQLAKFTASDAAILDHFGSSVAISGNTALVGASTRGSAYIFDVTTGEQLAKLSIPDPNSGFFGNSMSVSGNTALIGAWFDGGGNGDGSETGAAYLFDIITGNQLAKLTASDAKAFDQFGSSVAISGNTALVGARSDGVSDGSAYLFDVATGNQLAKLTASDATRRSHFGNSVAINGNTILVGAWLDNSGGNNSGSAYLFENTIPEPSSLLLATLAGLFGLGSTYRRRLNHDDTTGTTRK